MFGAVFWCVSLVILRGEFDAGFAGFCLRFGGFSLKAFWWKKIPATTYDDVVVIVLLMLPLSRSEVHSVGKSSSDDVEACQNGMLN